MSRTVGVLAVLVSWAIPLQAVAQQTPTPEELLPKDSVVYLRYDGMDGHRQAYNQTVLARLMREDFGQLVGYLMQLGQDALGPEVLSERLLAGAKPAQLLALQKATKGLPRLIEHLQRKGIAAGLEVLDPTTPRLQATVVLPEAGKDEKSRAAVLGAIQLFGLVFDVEVQRAKHAGRDVLHFEEEGVRVACWRESDHMVVTIGTEDVPHTLALVDGKRPNLAAKEAYTQVSKFDSYETCARGLVDVQGIIQVAQKAFPPAAAIAKQLGLADLNNVSLHFGFEGKYQRSTFVLDTTGKRTGLLRLISAQEPVALKQLPAIPPDATSVYASRLDWGTTFDYVVDSIKAVMKIVMPFARPEDVDTAIEDFEKAIGLDLRKDLFATLGSGVVLFNAPSQGPLSLGYTVALEVKDEKKLTQSLDTLIKSLAALTGADVTVKTRKYRGVDLHMVRVGEMGFFFTPSYAIHDGWLAVSFFPQPVQAAVMRSGGSDFSSWKPPPLMDNALSDARKLAGANGKITSLSMVDPRPGVEQVLSITPLIIAAFQSFGGGGTDFDVSLIPNAQSVTELIGPTVAVGVDDGKTIRFDSFGTFPIPLEVSGLDVYAFFILSFGLAQAQ